MGQSSWTTDAHKEYLFSRLAEYKTYQDKSSYKRFWSALFEDWEKKFPEHELLFPGQDPDTLSKEEKKIVGDAVDIRQGQLQNWYRWKCNVRARGVKQKKTKLEKDVLPPRTRCPQLLEYYSKMCYDERVKPFVIQRLEAMRDPSGGDKLNVIRETTREMFEKESPEFQEQIIKAHAELKAQPDEPKSRSAEDYARAIKECSSVLTRFFTSLSEETGWAFSVLMGGPNPEIKGKVTVASYHVGEAAPGQTFGVVYPQFGDGIIEPYSDFLKHIFLSDARAAQSHGDEVEGEEEEGRVVNVGPSKNGGASSPDTSAASFPPSQSSPTHHAPPHAPPSAPVLSLPFHAPPLPTSAPTTDTSQAPLAPPLIQPLGVTNAPSNLAPSTRLLAPSDRPLAPSDAPSTRLLAPSDRPLAPSDAPSDRFLAPLPETSSSVPPDQQPGFEVGSMTSTGNGAFDFIQGFGVNSMTSTGDGTFDFGGIDFNGLDFSAFHYDPLDEPHAQPYTQWPTLPAFNANGGTHRNSSLIEELNSDVLPAPALPVDPAFFTPFQPIMFDSSAVIFPPTTPTHQGETSPPSPHIAPQAITHQADGGTVPSCPESRPTAPRALTPPPVDPIPAPVTARVPTPPPVDPIPSHPAPIIVPAPMPPPVAISRHSGRAIVPSGRAQQMNNIGSKPKSTRTVDTSDANKENHPPGTTQPPPSWLLAAEEHFAEKEFGPEWAECLKAWRAFENHLGYTNKKPMPCLDLRPHEWTQWISKGRNGMRAYDQAPVITSPLEFGLAVMKWWCAIQPTFRQSADSQMPLPIYDNPNSSNCWEALRRGGPNGMLSMLTLLAWWGQCRKLGSQWEENSETHWSACVVDLRRVFERIVSEKKRGAPAAPSAVALKKAKA